MSNRNSVPATFVILLICLSAHGQLKQKPISGLPTGTPQSVGMSADTIRKVVGLIKTTPPYDFRGLVVVKDNQLVTEEYFNTYWRETVHDIRSAGKSVTAILLGIAIDKGLVKNTEQSIYDFFPVKKFKTPPPENRPDIRIKHLLTMSFGLDADDDDPTSPGATGNWFAKGDWVNHGLNLAKKYEPGEKWVYNDVCPMLIGAIIEERSGKKLADFANEYLFEPLNITEHYWYTGADGRTGPAGNLYISTLDFAKIGMVVLNKGMWNTERIVSEAWTKEITKKQIDFSQKNPFSNGYGSFWWIGEREEAGKKYQYAFASGNGGNVLFVVPSENMVVAITSSAYGQGYGHNRTHIIFGYVLRSITKK